MPVCQSALLVCGSSSTLSYQLTVIFQNTFRFLVKYMPGPWIMADIWGQDPGLPRRGWEWNKGEPDPELAGPGSAEKPAVKDGPWATVKAERCPGHARVRRTVRDTRSWFLPLPGSLSHPSKVSEQGSHVVRWPAGSPPEKGHVWTCLKSWEQTWVGIAEVFFLLVPGSCRCVLLLLLIWKAFLVQWCPSPSSNS